MDNLMNNLMYNNEEFLNKNGYKIDKNELKMDNLMILNCENCNSLDI